MCEFVWTIQLFKIFAFLDILPFFLSRNEIAFPDILPWAHSWVRKSFSAKYIKVENSLSTNLESYTRPPRFKFDFKIFNVLTFTLIYIIKHMLQGVNIYFNIHFNIYFNIHFNICLNIHFNIYFEVLANTFCQQIPCPALWKVKELWQNSFKLANYQLLYV